METVYGVFIVLHLLSWALVLGGWFATMRNPRVTPGMLHGSFGALLFGVILVGIAEMSDFSPNHMKLGVKSLVAVIVVLLLVIAKRQLAAVNAADAAHAAEVAQSEQDAALAATTSAGSRVLINIAGVLVIVNVAIAVLWK